MTVDRRIIDLYNEYVHTALPRREFLSRLTKLAGGAAAATTATIVIVPSACGWKGDWSAVHSQSPAAGNRVCAT